MAYTSFLSTAESEVVRFKNGEVIVGVDNVVYDELLEQANHGKRPELTSYLGKSSPYTLEEVQAGISRLILFGRESSAFYQEGMSLGLTEENPNDIYPEEMCLTPERAWKQSFKLAHSNTLDKIEDAKMLLERKAIIWSDFFLKLYDKCRIYGGDEEQVLRDALEYNRRYFLTALREYRKLSEASKESKIHETEPTETTKESLLDKISDNVGLVIEKKREEKRLALERTEMAFEQFRGELYEKSRSDYRFEENLHHLNIYPEQMGGEELIRRLRDEGISPEDVYQRSSYELSKEVERHIEAREPYRARGFDFMRRGLRGK